MRFVLFFVLQQIIHWDLVLENLPLFHYSPLNNWGHKHWAVAAAAKTTTTAVGTTNNGFQYAQHTHICTTRINFFLLIFHIALSPAVPFSFISLPPLTDRSYSCCHCCLRLGLQKIGTFLDVMLILFCHCCAVLGFLFSSFCFFSFVFFCLKLDFVLSFKWNFNSLLQRTNRMSDLSWSFWIFLKLKTVQTRIFFRCSKKKNGKICCVCGCVCTDSCVLCDNKCECVCVWLCAAVCKMGGIKTKTTNSRTGCVQWMPASIAVVTILWRKEREREKVRQRKTS